MKKYTYLVNFDSQTLERVGESFAVKGDGGIAELEFTIPSNFGISANQALWRVFFKLPGERESLFETLPAVAATESGDYVTSWTISKAVTQKAGRLAFSLAAISGNDIQWNSRTVIMQVPESQYQPESEEAEEPYTGRLTILEGDMAQIRGEFAEVQEDFEDLKETATLGTPIPKSLASEMVEGGVYLYTGTEPGYTAGHVYYYVGGALTDGGVYGGTAVDATLTQSGQAADAAVTGAEISAIKEDLFAYNAADILAPIATYRSGTLNGITYTWDSTNQSCTATGEPAGNTYTNMIASQNSLPDGLEAGKQYYVTFKTTNPNFVLFFIFYGEGSVLGTVSVINNAYIKIPDGCNGIVVRLRVLTNINGEATASNIAILTAEPNSILADKIAINASVSTDFLKSYRGSNNTINGVSFNWQGGTCTVSGTATARADYNIIDSQQSLLNNMQVGDSFIFACDKTGTKIISQVVFYDNNGNVITRKTGTSLNVPFVIPTSTVGITVRLYVNNGDTVNGSVSNIKLVKLNNKKMSVPLIVSFIDDDTTSDTLVTKYHDACCHNGIKGSYAVITKQLEDGNTQASKLLSYEDEGFGMCIHCYQQSGVAEWNATVRTDAVANTCRANLAKGLRQMQGYGFLNFAHWITPGGHAEPDLKETAKMLGCKCLITTNDGRANLMQDINPWRIKRISLRHDDNGTSENSLEGVKSIIDKTVSEGSGWLIITTHFNDGWNNLTWDETLDGNGYPIGYSRFNEIVQYAISAGMVPMTIPQAWTYYEDILTANIAECNKANA